MKDGIPTVKFRPFAINAILLHLFPESPSAKSGEKDVLHFGEQVML